MKVEDMLSCLGSPVEIEFRNSKDVLICNTISDKEGVIPYLERTVLKWFPCCGMATREICIFLEDESGGAE